MKEFCFLLRGQKAFNFLSGYISTIEKSQSLTVYIDEETNVQTTFHLDIQNLCSKNKIEAYLYKTKKPNFTDYKSIIAIGWSYMVNSDNLFVVHDSILPRYRGFNPLVSALLNGEKMIGATFLKAVDKVDAGPIYSQITTDIQYPIKIETALEKISKIYFEFGKSLELILNDRKKFPILLQDETKSSFSIWRDEDDYKVDWNKSAVEIKRFIDSVGYPYLGASTLLNGEKIRILDSEIYSILKIENRTPGKVFMIESGCPVILCGDGLLKITKLQSDNVENLLPFKKLKIRFS